MVASLFTAEVFAVYVNGAMQLPLVPIILGSVTAVLLADMARWFREGERDKAVQLWGKAAVHCACILIPVMVCCLILSREIMVIIYGARYADSALPFSIYLLAVPLRIVSWDAMLMAADKTPIIMWRSGIGLLLNLVLSLALMKVWGFTGAAWATVIVLYVIHLGVSLPQIARIYGKSLVDLLPWTTLLKIAAVSGLAGLCIHPSAWQWIDPMLVRSLARATFFFGLSGLLLQFTGCVDVREVLRQLKPGHDTEAER